MKKRKFTKEDQQKLLTLMYALKDKANEIQSFLEDFEDFYDNDQKLFSSETNAVMKNCFEAANESIKAWGRCRGKFEDN